ncbi:MAG: NAD(P)H:quinone oxidoreductase [Candidatus Gastranaerophilales bacterium]|nr:NAD(P)H:quinone oxidoreductase [Candidatus Gastranaerophilales bacterium]
MKVLIIYYSMFGNTFQLAKNIAEGVEMIDNTEVFLKQVPDLLPEFVIDNDEKVKHAKELQKDIPIASPSEIADYDAIIWGFPTRYGNVCSQMRNFIDQTGSLWATGKLEGKVTGVFCSTASIHGGQETTLVSAILPLMHLGMIVVGVPYSVPEMSTTKSGGTPYGPTHVAGANSDNPISQEEAAIAKAFGKRIAEIAAKLRD